MAMPVRKCIGVAFIIAGMLLICDTITFIRTGWSPLGVPLSVEDEFKQAFLLILIGAFCLIGKWFVSLVRYWAPGNDVNVNPGFTYDSTEVKRKRRLPLLPRMSVLPDRGVIFGMPVLMMVLVLYFMVRPIPSRGVYVSVTTPGSPALTTKAEQPVVVEVRLSSGPRPWEKPPLYRVQGELVPQGELRNRLKHELARRGEWVVYIYGDDGLSFQSVAIVMDVVNGLGGRPVLVGRRRVGEKR